MLSLLRRAIDSKRLSEQLDVAESRIATLEAELKDARQRPAFSQVSKDFDVSQLHDDVTRRVVDDFADMLSESAMRMLRDAMRSLPKYSDPRMIVSAAYDVDYRCYEFEFRVPAMGTRIRAVK